MGENKSINANHPEQETDEVGARAKAQAEGRGEAIQLQHSTMDTGQHQAQEIEPVMR